MEDWPDWWEWELEFTTHLLKRMIDRDFTEAELRDMIEHASAVMPDAVEGRWIVETLKDGDYWQVIVEPLELEQITLVITAYQVS